MIAPVPACLMPYAEASAWVAWNAERHNGEMRKVPKCPRTGGNASVSDPHTWGTLAGARRLAEVRAYPGVGIVSAAVPELVFLDLDRCLDPASGEPTNADAERLLDACADTYAERTPSGAGARIIGTAPDIHATLSRRSTTPGGLALEIYKAAPRYLTVTARRYGAHPDALADIGDVVLDLLPLFGGPHGAEAGHGDSREDAELVRRVVTGEGFHAELCALAARYIGRGMSAPATTETLRGLMLSHPEAARDDRWRDRFASIPDLVASASRKYAESAQHRRTLARMALNLLKAGMPGQELLGRLHAANAALAQPLPADTVGSIATWAARTARGAADAAR